MKISVVEKEVKQAHNVFIGFDVGLETLDFHTEIDKGDRIVKVADKIRNRTAKIEEALVKLRELANPGTRLVVVCEPSGGYEQKLLRTARRLGMETRRVNPESVNKLKMAANNDTGKTDPIDARLIHEVAVKWKTFSANGLPPLYRELDLLHKAYNDETNALARLRNHIHDALKKLFCDLTLKAKSVYSKTGRAVMESYGFNPWRIIDGGRKRFVETIKSKVRIRSMDTLVRIWDDACQSTLNGLSDSERAMLEGRLAVLWCDFLKLEARKAGIKREMADTYRFLPEAAKLSPLRGVSEFEKARIVAETGPLDNFKSFRQILKFAGLNLIENDSGKRVGEKRMSKKGRVPLRAAISQAAARQTAKGGMFREYHAGKVAAGMEKGKSLAACARRLVKIIFGVWKSTAAFSENRLFRCESEYAGGQAAGF